MWPLWYSASYSMPTYADCGNVGPRYAARCRLDWWCENSGLAAPDASQSQTRSEMIQDNQRTSRRQPITDEIWNDTGQSEKHPDASQSQTRSERIQANQKNMQMSTNHRQDLKWYRTIRETCWRQPITNKLIGPRSMNDKKKKMLEDQWKI